MVESCRRVCELVRKTVETEIARPKHVDDETKAIVARRLAGEFAEPKHGDNKLETAAETLHRGIQAIRAALGDLSRAVWFVRALKKPTVRNAGKETEATVGRFVRDTQFSLLALQLVGLLQAQREGAAGVDGPRTVLWVDDYPENNADEVKTVREKHGSTVVQCRSTNEARDYLGSKPELKGQPPSRFRIITDLHRDDEGDDAGKHFIEWLRAEGWNAPVLIFCRRNEAGIPIQMANGNVLLATKQAQLFLYCSSMEDRAKPAAAKRKPPARSHKKRGRGEKSSPSSSDTERDNEHPPAAAVAAAPAPPQGVQKPDDFELEGPPMAIDEPVVAAAAAAAELAPAPQPKKKKAESSKEAKYTVTNKAERRLPSDGVELSSFTISVSEGVPRWNSLKVTCTRCSDGVAVGTYVPPPLPAGAKRDALLVTLKEACVPLSPLGEYSIAITEDGRSVCPAISVAVVAGKISAAATAVVGDGLPTETEAGTNVTFSVAVRDSAGNAIASAATESLSVVATGPADTRIVGRVASPCGRDGICTCSLQPTRSGTYTVSVLNGEANVAGSPFKLVVKAGPATAIEVKGLDKERPYVAGETMNDILVVLWDSHKNEVRGLKPGQRFVITASDDALVAYRGIVPNPLTGRTIIKGVAITPVRTGQHELSIGIEGGPALHVPIAIVAGLPDASKCVVTGDVLLTGSCPVGELSRVHVDVRDSCGFSIGNGGDDTARGISVEFKCDGPTALAGFVKRAAGQTLGYDITFFPTVPGKYTARIHLCGKPIASTPFVFVVGDGDAEGNSKGVVPRPVIPVAKKAEADSGEATEPDDVPTEPDVSPVKAPVKQQPPLPKRPIAMDEECAPTLTFDDDIDDESTLPVANIDRAPQPAPAPKEKEKEKPQKKKPAPSPSGVDLPTLPLGI